MDGLQGRTPDVGTDAGPQGEGGTRNRSEYAKPSRVRSARSSCAPGARRSFKVPEPMHVEFRWTRETIRFPHPPNPSRERLHVPTC
eukprot:scaffold1141_cov333-Pavlova_lutheri.AAC.6